MKQIDVTVTRAIPAPVENVFDVWMDPKSPGGPWFGAERLIVNPLVDGLFYIALKARRTNVAALRELPRDRSASQSGVHVGV
jgi:hypothetical protein